ncbi:MAG: NAD(P)/FAD-dependent oxidoreductase [Euryarchaeota archaeon]|nr:NAD(P)/FAD-dependent oxidoreductase [Euryarchaeota archaeon]
MAISGAGPTGSYCASLCAKAGLRTLLVERETPPWTKCCAGGVLMRAAGRLDVPIPAGIIEKEVRGFIIRGNDFEERFRFDRCLTYTVDRKNLDNFLFKNAERSGAEIIGGKMVGEIVERDDRVDLNIGGQVVSAKAAVIAEGINSRNAMKLFGPYPRDAKAIGMRVILDTEEDPGDVIEVDLLDSPTRWPRRHPMFPLMGWMFPYRGRANFGVGGHGYSRAELEAGLSRTMGRSIVRTKGPIQRPESHPIPIWPRRRTATNRVLLVGDSAGLVSPLSGEGLSHGLHSSILAARAVDGLLEGNRDAFREYQQEVQSTVIRDIKAAAFISPVLHWLIGVVDTGEFFRVVRRDEPYLNAWTRMACGEESWQTLMAMTIPRFPRLFFSSLRH